MKLFQVVSMQFGMGLIVTALIVKNDGLLFFALGWLSMATVIYLMIMISRRTKP